MPRSILSFLATGLILLATAWPVSGAGTAEDYYQMAVQGFAGGDSLNAFAQLNQSLKLDPEHGPARLERARIYLALRNYQGAWEDYGLAFRNHNGDVRWEAYAGLSDTFRELRKRRMITDQFIDTANPLDPAHPEEIYAKAQLAYQSGTTEGNRMARRLILRLIEFNPGYNNVYRMWRNSFRDQTPAECEEVDQCLVKFLASHPDSTDWWLELAHDRFTLGQIDKTLETLDQLESANPRFVSADVPLLRARCKLDQDDERSFQYYYSKALDTATQTGDFNHLMRQAETVFTKSDYDEWEKFGKGGDKAAFLRRFWVRLQSDPFLPLNTRLAEHYRRLRQAELHYSLTNLQSFEKFSQQTSRLDLPQNELSDIGASVVWEHAINLGFDPRGLLYIRFGAPDSALKAPQNRFQGDSLETWFYGKIPFTFQRLGQDQDFVFRPMQYEKSLGDMIRQLQSERLNDPNVHFAQDYFEAQFLSRDGHDVDLEFYQDEKIPGRNPPLADIALFDKNWRSVLLQKSPVYNEKFDGNSEWLAVHRVTVPPGMYRYALRLRSGDQRWMAQGVLNIEPFPADSLSLSAVVLGSVPESGVPEYARGQVPLVPRPSTRFGQGETVNVYLEVYGLRPDQNGVRSYLEWVNIARLQEGEKKVRKFQGKSESPLQFEEVSTQTMLSHLFQRVAPNPEGPVVEVFTLETTGLLPGSYRLLIQVRDLSNSYWDLEETFFDVLPDKTQAER